MRIIGGTHRSRRILPPPDEAVTRPITDRVKQSLFDRLVSMEAMGGHVLDVFAGTGSLGLEALSRGADTCTFIERHQQARELLERNIAALGLSDQATVLKSDALATGWVRLLGHLPLRLVFIDPPYATMREAAGLARVMDLARDLGPQMEDDGVLVLRCEVELAPPAAEGWTGPDSHKYGSMALHFYRWPPQTGERTDAEIS